jgi:sodium-dependent phosphate transporter
MYTWIFVAGILNSFLDACGIGSNDLANSFGTTYGSKVLNVRQIVILAAICEFAGAMLLGSSVTSTLAGSISNVSYFKAQPGVLMYGMLTALAGSTTWLFTASYLGLPVSTTHSIVGGIMGFSLVYKGAEGVIWTKPISEFPYTSGFVPIVVSWITSPLISGVISAIFYLSLKYLVLKPNRSAERVVYLLPPLISLTIFIESLFVLSKGAKSRLAWPFETTLWVSICIGLGTGLLSIIGIPYLQKKLKAYKAALSIQAEPLPQLQDLSSNGTDIQNPSTQIVPIDISGTKVNQEEQYDPQLEFIFKYFQIFTSICTSFAHGANDVSNAVGPLAAIYYIYKNESVASKIEVDDWILALGGAGIIVGLATYGVNIMRILGEKITYISSSRGFCAELATALVVSFASRYGLPISSTQCITGAIIGISICDRNWKYLEWKLFSKIFISWIGTIFITGMISAGLFAQGVYSPNI